MVPVVVRDTRKIRATSEGFFASGTYAGNILHSNMFIVGENAVRHRNSLLQKIKLIDHTVYEFYDGAGSRGRTDTVSLPQDFESSASASSTTPASTLL